MRTCLKTLLHLALILLPALCLSQTDKKNRERADYYYRHLAFAEAIPYYRDIEKRTFSDNCRLGDCYRLTNEPAKAANFYGKAVAADNGSVPHLKLRYGQALMTLGKYKEAEKWLAQYSKRAPADRRTKNLIASCRTAGDRKAVMSRGYATFLSHLNTDRNEFAPTIWKNKLVFTTDSTYAVNKKNDKWTGDNFFNIYMASFDTAKQMYGGEITNAPRVQKRNTRYHDGPCTFASEVNEMYFTRTRSRRLTGKSKPNKDSVALLTIMVASNYDTLEKAFLKVRPFAFNSKHYSVAHPAISPDGRTLIFASDKKGGAGGYDLYICRRQANGEWMPPENLGNLINTEGDELFPFLADGKTLYFSSDGQRDCLGGLDVYKSAFNGTRWVQAENAGIPVNSSYDDISLAMYEEGSSSYFSSNRPAKTAGDNIYFFQRKQLFVLFDIKDAATKKPLQDAAISFIAATDTLRARSNTEGRYMDSLSAKFPYSYKAAVAAQGYDTFMTASVFNGSDKRRDTIRIAARLLKKQEAPADGPITEEGDRRIIFNLKITDCRTRKPVKDTAVNVTFDSSARRINYYLDAEPRNGELTRQLYPGKKYMLEVSSYDYKPLYLTKINTDFRHNTTGDTVIYDSVCLDAREDIIDLGLIPFDYDSWHLNQVAQNRLSKFVKYLKEQHPTMRLLIRGHTDCRETRPGYNKLLSERRARSVMKYFISKGVSAGRLRSTGVKDDMPRIRCNNCETDDSRKKVIKKAHADGITDCGPSEHAENRYIDCVILSY